jgi:hypothetical protein
MKGAPFVWADDYEASSCTIKKKLVSAPIFKLRESGKRFIVYTDASRVGLIYMFIKEGRVISYATKNLSMRRIILTHDLELAAVVFALKIWRHNRYGESCDIFTDH